MPSLDLSPADAAALPSGQGPDAIRRALRGPAGRVALLLPAPEGDAHRRVALALLEEAGAARGGTVLETATGALLLTEATPPDAARAEALLVRLPGAAPTRFALPEDGAALLALPAPVPARPPPPAPAASGIEALADAAPLAALLRRDGVLHIAAGAARRIALLRLQVAPGALAPQLGAAARDADLARHAADRLRGRLLDLLADPARRDGLLGGAPPVPLLLDLPAALLPDPPAPAAADPPPADPAIFAALPAAGMLDHGLAARRAALRHAGWGLAVRGLDAAALAVLAPETLPADLLLLRWSPALTMRTAATALRRIDPARLVLTRCDAQDALEWGLALGIARYAGPWIAALMAATRMAACRHAAGCTRAQCVARGRAAEDAGRAGCADRALLGALVPPA
jgi:hypothetical protein